MFYTPIKLGVLTNQSARRVLSIFSFSVRLKYIVKEFMWANHSKFSTLVKTISGQLLLIPIIIFLSARERAEFNKSCNLICSWSGRNFLIRTATAGGIRRVDLFLERISASRQSLALFTLPSTINQRKLISIHLWMARKAPVSKFN